MKFRLSGSFGELSPVRGMQPHSGIDLAIPENSTLRAINEGIIDKVFDGSGLIGKGLSIKFPDGTRAIYGHMNQVKSHIGDHVHTGDVIGLSGSTGNSTAPHLHFSLKNPDGSLIDPTLLADKLATISGNDVTPGVLSATFGNTSHLGPLGHLFNWGTQSIREQAADVSHDVILGILDTLKDFLLDATLIGSAIMIILKVAGWKDGGRYTGMLIVANILIKYLFGVY